MSHMSMVVNGTLLIFVTNIGMNFFFGFIISYPFFFVEYSSAIDSNDNFLFFPNVEFKFL